MEKQLKTKSVIGKKRKRKTSATITATEPKTIKPEALITKQTILELSKSPSKNKKKIKVTISEQTPVVENIKTESVESVSPKKVNAAVQKTPFPAVMYEGISLDQAGEKYPILKNQELIDRFLKVPFTNNQKGRIRQAIKLQLQGSDSTVSAEIIHGKIQNILKSSENLTDSDLRKIRILHNMLRIAINPKQAETLQQVKPKKEKGKKKNKEIIRKKDTEESEGEVKKEKQIQNKVKGPKRYVVFLGNLPLDVDKEKLMSHFREIDEHIKDIRIPKLVEGKKAAIAFMEVDSEAMYEMALSKNHSMLDNKRIKVSYTTQQNSKITKSEAKGKSAKLSAMQKSGKLAGSIPLTKKRSHRRNIMKRAKAKETAAENA